MREKSECLVAVKMRSGSFYSSVLSLTSSLTSSPVTPSGSDYSNSYRGSPCSSTAGSNVSSINDNRKLDNVMAVFAEQAELLAQSNEASKNTI